MIARNFWWLLPQAKLYSFMPSTGKALVDRDNGSFVRLFHFVLWNAHCSFQGAAKT